MKRREFITLLGSAAAWPLLALAQQSVRMRLVGVLMSLADNDPGGQAEVEAFYHGLTALGWVEGRNIRIEFRWAGGNIERAK
jgi:putative ABC transport system substrate-binding protein